MIKDQTKSIDHGFFWVNAFFIAINCLGLVMNMSLYYLDINYNNGVLDKVDGDEQSEDTFEVKEINSASETTSKKTD
jgi:hypothetical protein